MYFVARRVSLPSIDAMLKKERASPESKEKMYYDFSKQLNELINSYFSCTNEGK